MYNRFPPSMGRTNRIVDHFHERSIVHRERLGRSVIHEGATRLFLMESVVFRSISQFMPLFLTSIEQWRRYRGLEQFQNPAYYCHSSHFALQYWTTAQTHSSGVPFVHIMSFSTSLSCFDEFH